MKKIFIKNLFYREKIMLHKGSSLSALSLCLLTVFLILCGTVIGGSMTARADEPYVVVIDPGHGGSNLGAEYDGYTEKDMTMIVARAMKEELEQYENVVVYLTREMDMDMTIKDRALFASERDADLLVCLHFNSSVRHNLYGAEVWVPAFDSLYTKGRQFAEIEMELLTETGLYSRGIKTRLNDAGDNYYGILRYCSEYQVPSALVEHCHLDQYRDKPFYQQGEQQLQELGRLDGEAVARYFRLRSTVKGVDYSDYPLPEPVVVSGVIKPDKTAPEVCELKNVSVDEENGSVTFTIRGEDSDSFIMYYDYSIDGGNSYSELMSWNRPVWNRSEEEMTVTIDVPYDKEIELTVSIYNGFDVWTDSEIVTVPAIPGPTPEPTQEPVDETNSSGQIQAQDEINENVYEKVTYDTEIISPAQLAENDKVVLIVLIIVISLLITLMLFVLVKLCFKLRSYNKGRKRQ